MKNGLRHMALYKSAISLWGGVPQGLNPVPKCHTLETVFQEAPPMKVFFLGRGYPSPPFFFSGNGGFPGVPLFSCSTYGGVPQGGSGAVVSPVLVGSDGIIP